MLDMPINIVFSISLLQATPTSHLNWHSDLKTIVNSNLISRGLELGHPTAQGLDGLLKVAHVRGPHERATNFLREWVGVRFRAVATATPPNTLFLV